MTTKVLVAGDVRGSLQQLFARVTTVHESKGPFDCLLCVGDFFGPEASSTLSILQSGELKAPVPIYILGPPPSGSPAPDSDGKSEVCPDVYCLHGAGILTLHNLRVAFTDSCPTLPGTMPTTDAVAELRRRAAEKGFLGCDALLTHEWPRGFCRNLADDAIPVSCCVTSGLSPLVEHMFAACT